MASESFLFIFRIKWQARTSEICIYIDAVSRVIDLNDIQWNIRMCVQKQSNCRAIDQFFVSSIYSMRHKQQYKCILLSSRISLSEANISSQLKNQEN